MKEEMTKTTTLLLGMIAVFVIISIVILANIYYTFIPHIPSTELNLEALAILSGIFIPITFLIFIDITRDESWRNIEHYKFISVIIFLFLFGALYFLFGAASIGIINNQTSIQNAISLLYTSMSLCAIILTAILTIYIYLLGSSIININGGFLIEKMALSLRAFLSEIGLPSFSQR